MPESLQGGERGDKMQDAITALDTAISSLEESASSIDSTNEEIETAKS